MQNLSVSYEENTKKLATRLRVDQSFDLIKRHLTVAGRNVCFFYIDGFVKDAEMLRIMQYLLSQKELGTAGELISKLPYIEVEIARDEDTVIRSVLSGQAVMLSESFGDEAVLLDVRTYPARGTEEPDSDRVMQGSHDGFVETLVINTALIRRRIRDPRLTMAHFNMGGSSKTDVVVCYMDGVADESLVKKISEKLTRARPKSLRNDIVILLSVTKLVLYVTKPLSLRTSPLIWCGNPFPGIHSILVLCDTSPQVMILPTSIFHYLEQTDDYYFPPLTGSYLRIVRTLILLASVVITPLWYLYLEYAAVLPPKLLFLVPDNPGALPIILQLFLVELAIDGLKIASMNTPDMLSNSLSIVGALILGDFAVEVGWLCGDVILYMAFVAIANFAQQNHELGYAFKFMRMMILALVYFFGVWGFSAGLILFCIFVATNKTVAGRHYLYPLVPFNKKAFARLLLRRRKRDFENN